MPGNNIYAALSSRHAYYNCSLLNEAPSALVSVRVPLEKQLLIVCSDYFSEVIIIIHLLQSEYIGKKNSRVTVHTLDLRVPCD